MPSKEFSRARKFKETLENILPEEKYSFKLTRVWISRGFGYTIKLFLDYTDVFTPIEIHKFTKKSSKYFSLISDYISNAYDEDVLNLKCCDIINTDENIYRSKLEIIPKKPEDSEAPIFPLSKGEQVIERIKTLIAKIKKKNTNTYHIEVSNPHLTSPRTQGVGVTFRLRSTKPDERDPEKYFKRFLISKIILNLHDDFNFSTSIRGYINDREKGVKKCSYLCYFTEFSKGPIKIKGEKFSQYYLDMIEKLHSFGFYKKFLKHKSVTHYMDIIEREIHKIKETDFLAPFDVAFLFEKDLYNLFEEHQLTEEEYNEWKTKLQGELKLKNKPSWQDSHVHKLLFLVENAYYHKWDFYERKWVSFPLIFKINDYLELRFEDNTTYIWVGEGNNKRIFTQCKYLLLNLPKTDQRIEEINSIDEAEQYYSNDLEGNTNPKIDPKTEFWGHCSNLQAWFRYDYDTRLLHRNIAFPLLKQLSKAGDPLAKKAFEEEILLRIEEGNNVVLQYFIEEGYFKFLGQEKLLDIVREWDPLVLCDIVIKINVCHFNEIFYKTLLNRLKEVNEREKILDLCLNYGLIYDSELNDYFKKLKDPLIQFIIEHKNYLNLGETFYSITYHHLTCKSKSLIESESESDFDPKDTLSFYVYHKPNLFNTEKAAKEKRCTFRHLKNNLQYFSNEVEYRIFDAFDGNESEREKIVDLFLSRSYYYLNFEKLKKYVNLFNKHKSTEIYILTPEFLADQNAYIISLYSTKTGNLITYLQYLEYPLLEYNIDAVNIASFFEIKYFDDFCIKHKKELQKSQTLLTDFMEVKD